MILLHLEYDKYPLEAIKQLESVAEVEKYDVSNQDELYNKLTGTKYDAVIVRLGINYDRMCIDLQPGLKYIITATTGLNHIDVPYAEIKGISVISLKDEQVFLSGIKSTAEHTWALLLALTRKLPAAVDSVNKGFWERIPFMADELNRKKLGIIGFGRLGKIVADYANAFGMEVIAFDKNPLVFKGHSFVRISSLDELLQKSDYISLHIDWSPDNNRFLDEREFSQMKEGVYFINTSRGECIREDVLLKYLTNGKIKGAGLDVLDGDSSWGKNSPEHHRLIDYARDNNNLIITPHTAGYGNDSIYKTRLFVSEKFINNIK
jgi:D-3-phosphoglycerate dehydrogenase